MNHYDLETDVAMGIGYALLAALVGLGAFLLTVGGALAWRRVH